MTGINWPKRATLSGRQMKAAVNRGGGLLELYDFYFRMFTSRAFERALFMAWLVGIDAG
jgi:hypothetical protein